MLSFRARLFLAFALLWLLFLGGGWYLAGRSVDQALKRRLEATLAQDALRAAEAGISIEPEALLDHTDLEPEQVVKKALEIAGELCIYTNMNHTVEVL